MEERRYSHRRGHHHRRSLWHRLRRWRRRHRSALAAVVLVAVFVAAAGLWMLNNTRGQSKYEVQLGRQALSDVNYLSVEHQGETYRYNNRLTTILYAGIDSETPLEATGAYTAAPRADSIQLIVLNGREHTLSIIALNRDTMTDIHKYTVDGKDRGAFVDHLALAYAYGDGGEASCENLCRAVTDLLFGIPIDCYVVSNRASLPLIAEAIGPAEVVVPNDDLSALGYRQGDGIVVDADNIEAFLRTRDIETDLSNTGRMERQRAYMAAALARLASLSSQDVDQFWRMLERSEGSVLTNIRRNRYLDLMGVLKNVRYSEADYYTPQGEQVVSVSHDEFYPDMNALHDKVLELFYLQK